MPPIDPPPPLIAGLRSGLIDIDFGPVNVRRMDLEESLPRRQGDPLDLLRRQDLDPLSVAELEARIAALEREIARSREKIERAVNHRATADAIFRR